MAKPTFEGLSDQEINDSIEAAKFKIAALEQEMESRKSNHLKPGDVVMYRDPQFSGGLRYIVVNPDGALAQKILVGKSHMTLLLNLEDGNLCWTPNPELYAKVNF